MKWHDISVGQQIGFGFGVVIFFLIVIGILSFSGVSGIVKNASEVIDGKALDSTLAQREVDHLNWAGSVNRLITDETVHSLEVETDHTQCGFGKWLYGEDRKAAEKLLPELIPILKEIEAPHRRLHESAARIKATYTKADTNLPEFIARKEIDHLNWTAAIQNAIIRNSDNINVETDHTLCSFGKWLYGSEAEKSARLDPDLARLLEEIKGPHKALHEAAIDLISVYRQTYPGIIEGIRKQMDAHRKWVSSISDDILEFRSQLSDTLGIESCGFSDWEKQPVTLSFFESPEHLTPVFSKIKTSHARIHDTGAKIDQSLKDGKFNDAEVLLKNDMRDALNDLENGFETAIAYERELDLANRQAVEMFEAKVIPELESTRKILQQIGNQADALLDGYLSAASIYANETVPTLHNIQRLLKKARQVTNENILTDQAMLNAAKGTKRNVAIFSIIALSFGIALAFLIASAIIRLLSDITSNLDDGSQQVASASDEISASSQALAEGASEQAASIEQTSSSLEELSSMTRRNADNASHADRLGRETGDAVSNSMISMSELTQSMEEISNASKETSQIIKTIDDIAFQTNLLALNAAVEAARAGEAGAGFAVVADEVRNLATRAASAARDTSDLIESTTAKVDQGSTLLEKTNTAFKEVEDNTQKIAKLVGEIASASKEQSNGIEQINLAVTEMDKVTQQNAANAEESASASEEMNAQASQMKSIVEKLVKLVGMNSGKVKIKSNRLLTHTKTSKIKGLLSRKTSVSRKP